MPFLFVINLKRYKRYICIPGLQDNLVGKICIQFFFKSKHFNNKKISLICDKVNGTNLICTLQSKDVLYVFMYVLWARGLIMLINYCIVLRRSAVHKNHNSAYHIYGVIALC